MEYNGVKPEITRTCPVCGHRWRAHSTAYGARIAQERGYKPVPCIEPDPTGVSYICGCPELSPEAVHTRRPTAGHI